jgi:dipeptidyl aminopeptidase/acylaminoacyl peptidase
MFKNRGSILFVGCLLLVGSLTGCGDITSNSEYYYNPSFTQSGKIVFIKGLQSTNKNVMGSQTGSSYTESLMNMTAAGAAETFLLDVTGNPPYAMTCSPTGEYAAYGDNLRNGLFEKIVVLNIGSGSGLARIELTFVPGVSSFDWSSDGTKLVYSTSTEVRITNLDGTGDALVTAESAISAVAWKAGNRIAFVHGATNKVLSLVYPANGNRQDLAVAASVDMPQISSANTNEVFGVAGGKYCSVDVSAGTPATTEVLANFKGALPRISPAGDTVVYSKIGESSGIYLLNIAGKTETKIK